MRYRHRAKTLPQIPLDYYERWDASTSEGMVFNTDEATGDIATWYGQCGVLPLSASTGGTTYPIWTEGKVTFTKANKGLHYSSAMSAFTGGDYSVFIVGVIASTNSTSAASLLAGPEFYTRIEYNTTGGGQADSFYNDGAANTVAPSNNMLDTLMAYGQVFDTTNTTQRTFFGGNSETTDTGMGALNSALTGFYIGMANTTATTTIDGYMTECIIYDRALSAAEAGQVLDYLSNKWSAQNEDSASSVIAAASTAAAWENSGADLDKDGQGITNHPGKQTGEYSIVRLPDRDADSKRNPNYPMDTFGSLVKFWFDAADTGHMTFATGDARAGGTVSSWTDRTGAVTMSTAASGDSAVNFFPRIHGKPAIQGGTSGTPRSLESNGNVTMAGTAAYQRLFWAVVEYNTDNLTQAPLSWNGSYLFPSLYSSFYGDVYPATDIPCIYADESGTFDYHPLSVENPVGRVAVVACRVTVSGGGTPTAELFYGGHQGAAVTCTTNVDATSFLVSVGAIPASSHDSDAYVYEFGGIDGGGSISDASCHNLIKWLCDKYDVDYMPDTTPMDIGLLARSTASGVAQTDTCLWFRSDKGLSEGAWALHPKCAALHTDPTLFTLLPYTNDNAVAEDVGRKVLRASDASVTGLVQANNYNSAETTDFPADTLGCSGFHISQHKSSTATSNGSFGGHYTGFCRFLGTSDVNVQHYESNASANWTGGVAADNWCILGGSYIYDSDGSGGIGETGSTDGDPYVWRICNDETPTETNAPVATSFNTKVAVGCSTSGAQQGDIDAVEVVVFKHPLVSREIENLKRYVRYRYNDLFT